MEWDWNVIRFDLFNALSCLKVHDIYLVEKEVNVVTISLIVEDVEKLRPIVRMRMIDNLIAKNNPELYRRYLFCYEVWDKKTWELLPVRKFFHRVKEIL